MTDFRTPPERELAREPVREPGSQPDPMLQTGRRSTGWIWLFAVLILAIVAGTLYGINNQEPQTATNAPAAQAQGETTGAAPKEQQADQQNKSEAGPQKADANKQGAPANSQNAAGPQKDQSGQTNQQAPKQ